MKASIAYDIEKYLVLAGIPRGPKSKVYCVDPVYGSDSNVGTNWKAPLKTLTAAEDKCVGDQHDTVLFLAGAPADAPTAMIAWDKSYTHLIGVGSELPGLGQRCRVVAAATVMHTPVITFSGNGCIVKNMQFGNEHATGDVCGVVGVTGQRNYFENVFFMVPFSATAGSYSLKITDGGENVFKRCTIGQHTCVRGAATYGLWIAQGSGVGYPSRTKFIDCEFLSWSSVTTHVLVLLDVDNNKEAFTVFFENCLFDNFPGSGEAGGLLAEAINDNIVQHHQVIMRGENLCAGCSALGATLTYILGRNHFSGAVMAAVVEAAEGA
jgi:hypothetical protein